MKTQMIEVTKQTINDVAVQAVNARELHSYIENKDHFSTWMQDRISQYGFTENIDFVTYSGNPEKGRPSREYAISLDMAKELSMVERNAKGKQARQYFIQCEKDLKADPIRIAKQPKERDEALAKIRTAKALQMNIDSAAKIYALFPHLGSQSQQVILSKIVGDGIVPLPVLEYRTYTATEVAEKLGVTANFIGRTANANGLKTDEFGIFVLDKSRSSEKQVETFRYNDKAIAVLSDLIVTSRLTISGALE